MDGPGSNFFGGFTRNEKFEPFRDELAKFVDQSLSSELAVFVLVTTEPELGSLARATDTAKLFNYTKSPNGFVGVPVFDALKIHLQTMAANRQRLERSTYRKDYVSSHEERFLRSFVESCVMSFEVKGGILVVSVGGFIDKTEAGRHATCVGDFLRKCFV